MFTKDSSTTIHTEMNRPVYTHVFDVYACVWAADERVVDKLALEGVNRGVNKACEPIALLLVLLLLLLHSSTEFVQSAAALPPPRSPCLCPPALHGTIGQGRGEGRMEEEYPLLKTRVDRSGSPNISTNTNSDQDVLAHELSAMQRNEQAQAEQMFLLALHERLAQQLRPQTELQRIWQNMMLGLPALLPPLDLTALPGTSQALMHPLYQTRNLPV
ncbi:unnamed protein product [Cercopithifilaria johnstoni]|uniref:Uncharacterized protein n=1 Tax=Cercopithifilaria johnstoni TaxID=2874296 RepID=A0A8J2M4M5_9BILA|nr:unnamed protein product [Cercopithifilaria johnstoni]